ncbi:translation initiation factor IF-2 subunit alpha [Candidatus Woesearchaeota archaeon]|nr:translation initiation factor IF-2 subunit alpha [Candidatus Woesearchaeota archaeon]
MLRTKTGFPQESEVVLCTVTNIQYNSVFAKIDEYQDLVGMIHISEISPGRIRNIRDYVKEGKVIVCKVLRVHDRRGHVDLSLRRVGENQRRKKLEDVKLEQKAEKILEFAAQKLKTKKVDLFKKIEKEVYAEYDSLYASFEDVIENDTSLKSLGIDLKIVEVLEEEIRQKIKPSVVELKGNINITSYDSDGISIVKEALAKAKKVDESISITYEGAGNFKIKINAKDYKEAEDTLKEAVSKGEDYAKSKDATFEFVKIEN